MVNTEHVVSHNIVIWSKSLMTLQLFMRKIYNSNSYETHLLFSYFIWLFYFITNISSSSMSIQIMWSLDWLRKSVLCLRYCYWAKVVKFRKYWEITQAKIKIPKEEPLKTKDVQRLYLYVQPIRATNIYGNVFPLFYNFSVNVWCLKSIILLENIHFYCSSFYIFPTTRSWIRKSKDDV
jgi:hypothetical protein